MVSGNAFNLRFLLHLGHDLCVFQRRKISAGGLAGHKSLAGYCSKIGVTGDGKTPQTVTKEVFEPAKNPLICASSLEEAKQSYGLFVQGQSRKASTQMVFMFIGAWLVILLALFGLMKWTNRKAAPESASTAEKSKSKARR